MLSHYDILSVYILGIYPFVRTWCAVLLGRFCCAQLFLALTPCQCTYISFHILSPNREKKVAYFQSLTQYLVHNERRVEPLCHDTEYQALLFVGICCRRCGAAADTRRWRLQQWEPVRCCDGPGAGVAAGPPTPPISATFIPPPPTSFPSPSSRRRCRRRQYQAAAQTTTGAGAAAATGPEPAPPTTGAGGGRMMARIWGRGNKAQWLTLLLSRTCT